MPQDKYAHERGDPAVAMCGRSALSIHFDGKMLRLRGGPIPAGEYWINPAQLWERPWYGFGQAGAWGDYRLTLHVMPGTVTHGRGGFFIHGGSPPAARAASI